MFKIGDVLRLKSGGPRMTVGEMDTDGTCRCEWFDKNHAFNHDIFKAKMLNKVEDEE